MDINYRNKLLGLLKRITQFFMDNPDKFIEVNKVVSEKGSDLNTGTCRVIISVSDIVNIRPWHKSRKDKAIKGDITQLTLSRPSDLKAYVVDGESVEPTHKQTNIRTMLIEENYDDFAYRLSQKALVKDIARKLHDIA